MKRREGEKKERERENGLCLFLASQVLYIYEITDKQSQVSSIGSIGSSSGRKQQQQQQQKQQHPSTQKRKVLYAVEYVQNRTLV